VALLATAHLFFADQGILRGESFAKMIVFECQTESERNVGNHPPYRENSDGFFCLASLQASGISELWCLCTYRALESEASGLCGVWGAVLLREHSLRNRRSTLGWACVHSVGREALRWVVR
jgi:hypothetical protein